MNEVAITGLGVISPYGIGVEENLTAWQESRNVLEPVSPGANVAVGRVHGLDPDSMLPDPRQLITISESGELACCSSILALRDAGIEPGDASLADAGLFFGFWSERRAMDDYVSIVRTSIDRKTRAFDPAKSIRVGLKSLPPYMLLRSLASVGAVSIQTGIKGPNAAFCSSTIAGGQAICAGLDALRMGEVQLALAGASDADTDAFGVCEHAFLGRRQTADGMKVGPGDVAVTLVLEEPAAAEKRGREPRGYILGYGECYKPPGDGSPAPTLEGVSRAVETCVRDCAEKNVRIDTVLHDDCISAPIIEQALQGTELRSEQVDIRSNATLAGDFLTASMPWSVSMAVMMGSGGNNVLVCSYGAMDSYSAVLVRRGT